MAGVAIMMRRAGMSTHPSFIEDDKLNVKLYERLDGDGLAYINTGYYPNSYDNIEVAFNLIYANLDIVRVVCGSRQSAQGKQVMIVVNSGGNTTFCSRFYSGTTPETDVVGYKNVIKMTLEADADGVFCKEYLQRVGSAKKLIETRVLGGDFNIQYPLYIFTANTVGASTIDTRRWKGGIFYVKITDARTGELKKSYVPAEYNGVAGMYEEVNDEFFINENNTGEFKLVNLL